MWSNAVSSAVALFREYMGTGLITIWYLAALFYLFWTEKKKANRILFVYLPLVLLLIYFNPLFAKFMLKEADGETYYRILWLLPVTIVIAYTCVRIYDRLPGRKRYIWAGAALALLMVSGSFIYANPNFHRAENRYHVPDSVVAVCDAIIVPGREVMAVFPAELVQYVRQYSPYVCMPYGREMLVERWVYGSELFDVMEAEKIDLDRLVPLVREAGCHYIILRKDKEMIGSPETYNWAWFGETEKYVIYRDMDMELFIPE